MQAINMPLLFLIANARHRHRHPASAASWYIAGSAHPGRAGRLHHLPGPAHRPRPPFRHDHPRRRHRRLSRRAHLRNPGYGLRGPRRAGCHPLTIALRPGPLRARLLRLRHSTTVLSRINFEVQPGQVVALLGSTGSGKSTIINLIPRFYDPTAGRILIDGHDIRQVTLHSLRSQIGIVLQETTLFADYDPRKHRLRPPGRHRGGDHPGCHSRPGARLHPRHAQGLQHPRRRARRHPLRRSKAAHRHRPRPAHGPPHPHPGRRHRLGRHRDRASDPACLREPDAGPHHLRHRPPPVHRPPRRPDPGAGERPHRRPRHPRTPCSRPPTIYAEIYNRQLKTAGGAQRMSFTIGTTTAGMGPRGALEHFGSAAGKDRGNFNPQCRPPPAGLPATPTPPHGAGLRPHAGRIRPDPG